MRYMLVVNRQGTTDSFPTPLQDHAGCRDTWESARPQISLSRFLLHGATLLSHRHFAFSREKKTNLSSF